MEQCSICLEALDGGGVVALACNHRFHAACLAEMAGAVGTATTRRGSLTACPNCRTVSRVNTSTPVVAFSVGDRVSALWGHRWFPGVIDEVVDGGDAYEIVWDDGDEGRVLAKNVRHETPAPVRPAPRRPVAPAAPAAAPEEEPTVPSAAPTRQKLMRCGNCKACRGRKGRPCSAPVALQLTSRFKGVCRSRCGKLWRATISVRWSLVKLGAFDDEEDAARAYDAAVVKYELSGRRLNFPGEESLASVLAALPEVDGGYDASVLARATATAAPRHERALAARRVAPPAPVSLKEIGGNAPRPVEMRRVGDAEWRWFESQSDAARAFGLSSIDVSRLINSSSVAQAVALREAFEARPARGPPKKRKRPTKAKAPRKKAKRVDGASQRANGKWYNPDMFPGRDFDDLDAYRAAKKQHYARREEYRAQRWR